MGTSEHPCMFALRGRERNSPLKEKKNGVEKPKTEHEERVGGLAGEGAAYMAQRHRQPRNMISDSIVLTRGRFSGLHSAQRPLPSPLASTLTNRLSLANRTSVIAYPIASQSLLDRIYYATDSRYILYPHPLC